MSSPHEESPVNPLPPVVAALALVIAGIEAAFQLGARGLIGGPEAVGWRLAAVQEYGLNTGIVDWMLANGRFPVEHVARFVTYPFVHGSFTHVLFVLVFLLALGKMVGEIFRPLAVLAVFFGSAIMGGLAYTVLIGGEAWLYGGFPAVYGLIGAFTFLLWVDLGLRGSNQMRAFSLIGFLMGIQLVFGLLFGGGSDWVADVFGFATGFLLSFVVSPGGWTRVVAKLRQR